MRYTGGLKRQGKMIFELSELIDFFRRSYEGTIVGEILSIVLCQRCGECCNLPVQVSFEDIDDISVFLGMSFDDFMKEYLDRKPDGEYYLKTPCPFFLEGNTCRIHQVKPEKCARAKHVEKKC